MKQVIVTSLLHAAASVSGTFLMKFQKEFALTVDQIHFEATTEPRPRKIRIGFSDLQIGIEMRFENGGYRSALVHLVPLDQQPLDYVVTVVKGIMIMNEVAALTGGAEIPITSLGLDQEITDSATAIIEETKKLDHIMNGKGDQSK